ncbi:MAG: hydrogenase expression/formation protein HypE [Armatimonadetes bacterium]|nr:hydrogenase expression/formation protein HypE [Armatimonadota bacterium]
MIEERILEGLEQARRKPPTFTAPRIDMSHGAGGQASHKLIEGLLLPALTNPALAPLSDAALLPCGDLRLALTTDALVVRPLVFPGGSIGDLAVNGTVNDLAVSGATPLALSAALIIEEGFDTALLREQIESMAAAARRASVPVATGDTKVVERGKGDGLYIITTGIGVVDAGLSLSAASIQPGDKILCSGTLGDHGTAIMIARGNLDLEAEVLSDTQPLTPLVAALKNAAGPSLRFMRDPTRGGVGTVLNELARDSGRGLVLWEGKLPIREVVQGACEILGLDPLYVANEGKLIAVVAPDAADAALAALQAVPGGEDAALIGEVRAEPARRVLLHTQFGGTRLIDMLVGDPLPRIC